MSRKTFTFSLDEKTHQKFKMETVNNGSQMSEVFETLMKQYILASQKIRNEK